MGYSRWEITPLPARTTARDWPSGPQSAHITLSRTSRGAPPANGTCASVPAWVKCAKATGCSEMAISPLGEIARICADGKPTEREFELSKRVEKISEGWPSHAAP